MAERQRFEWNDEKEQTIKDLWPDPLNTAEKIGKTIGGATKNMVIKRARKLGLPNREAKRPPRTPKQEAGKESNEPKKKPRKNEYGFVTPALAFMDANRLKVFAMFYYLKKKKVTIHITVEGKLRTTKRAAGDQGCRWPIGDPKQADFHYCGMPRLEGLPYKSRYCPFHGFLAFLKIRTVRTYAVRRRR